MRERLRKSNIGDLLALLLFAVFSACVLSVLLTGASAYQRLTDRDQASYTDRTALQYIASRVRQADRAGAVTVEDFHGVTALVLSEEGIDYATRIYFWDGYIRELFSASDLLPEDGEAVLGAQGLQMEKDGNALRLELLTENGRRVLCLTLRSGEGDAS